MTGPAARPGGKPPPVRRGRFQTDPLALAVLALLSLSGVAAALLATRWGVGLSPDSTDYITAARGLLAGRGLQVWGPEGSFVPLTHHPPFFPMTLSMIGLVGIEPLEGARLLNSVLFGLNIFLAGLVIDRLIGDGDLRAVTIVGAFFVLSSHTLLLVHTMAWSEPLFLFLGLSGLAMLALYLEEGGGRFFHAAALAVGLAFLTRYLGVALAAAGVCAIFLLSKKRWPARTCEAALFLLLASLPVLLWSLRGALLTGAPTDRQFGFHPLSLRHAAHFLDVLAAWVAPATTPRLVKGVLLLVILPAFAWTCSRPPWKLARGEPFPAICLLLSLSALFYCLALAASISFFDAATPVDYRILSPLFLFGLLLTVHAVRDLSRRARAKGVTRIAIAAALLLLAALYAYRAVRFTVEGYVSGRGFTAREWRESKTMERIKALPPPAPVYSNAYDAVFFFTGRTAVRIPYKFHTGASVGNADYESDLSRMKRRMIKEGGRLAYFYTVPWRRHFAAEEELVEKLGLRLLSRDTDGAIYDIP